MRGGKSRHPGARWTGISLLIFGLLHVPLPQPDYHNVRHHDAPGELCEHHDHLLRWHPDAGLARDVAILHWHWVLPESGPSDLSGPGSGAALHAHVAGWDAPTIEAGPPVMARETCRFLDVTPPPCGLLAILAVVDDPTASHRDGRPPVHGFGATFAPRASLSLLQRWAC
jgi:hypothetical protein